MSGTASRRTGDTHPGRLHVQTAERMKELEPVFTEKGWHYSIELKADELEDIQDLELLLHPPETMIASTTVGRNETTSCGSGKKYKKCCGQR